MLKREKAISFMIETTRILLPIAEKVPFIQNFLQIALKFCKIGIE
jgi:hypothetical protein